MTAPADVVEIRPRTAVSRLPGVGPRRATLLSRLGIATVSDLLRHLPTRYEHEFAEGAIRDLPMDGVGSARGTVVATRPVPRMGRGFKGGKSRFEATLQDHSDRVHLIWFNADYLRDKLHPGMVIRVSGKVKAFRGYPQMVNPRWEPLEDSTQTAAKEERLRPVYPATEDLPSLVIERLIAEVMPGVLPHVLDPLPAELLRDHQMPALADALRMAHQPTDEDEPKAARRRLAFNELLLLQLGIALKRHYNQTTLKAPPLRWSAAIDAHIRERFPFQLTPGQEKVVAEIAADLKGSVPMNRLLQGDVGSGKTVVALYALLMAVANRRQGALMAPTELLAEQHHLAISTMLEGSNVRLALITGGRVATERRALERDIAQGKVDIVIGTQALLTESVRFKDLAVVVVDEQHRFGVLQRAAFRGATKRGANGDEGAEFRGPHYLVMTATPIPRTLSLTVFGDLDVSIIEGMPPGRLPITTRVVPPEKADEVYRYLATRLERGEQAYVVLPIIDEAGQESATQLKSVREHAKLLQDKFCKGYRVAAVHGRLKHETREAVMHRFRAGQVHVLVATTVIEVGLDVPNASVMIVEHAERFGLAQLHQLRGRVGRGAGGRRSLCVFIAQPTTDDAAARMGAIAATQDGFKIAEEDLAIRGMGEFFGTRQHGQAPLRVARIPEDMDLLQLARRDAIKFITADPNMADPSLQLLRKVLLHQHGKALGLVDVG